MDAYIWLAYRLHSLNTPRLVSWRALKAQFGASYKELFHFKARFPTLLGLATAVYPEAKLDVMDGGVLLKPSPPPVSPKNPRLIHVGGITGLLR
jgi:hypothetical protein